MTDLVLARRVERIAQAIYDLRDAVRADDARTWRRLDEHATALSRLGARLARRGRVRS